MYIHEMAVKRVSLSFIFGLFCLFPAMEKFYIGKWRFSFRVYFIFGLFYGGRDY
jgi:hypothetical protein